MGVHRPAEHAYHRLCAVSHHAPDDCQRLGLELVAVPERVVESPETYVERCWAGTGCTGSGRHGVRGVEVSEAGIDVGGLFAYADCNPAGCPAGSAPQLMSIPRADFTLRDLADPVLVGTPSGDLFDITQPLTGTRTASFSASDQGGGVYQAILEVDGAPVTSAIIDGNDGRCVPPFAGAVPCKPSASGTLSYDTAGLADGAHSFRLVITDATGTNSASYGPLQVRTQNQIAECDPAVGAGATPVLAGLRGTRRSVVTRTPAGRR